VNGRDPFPELAVRAVEAEDVVRLARAFARLSPDTVYRRFFTLMPRPAPELLRRLAVVDHDTREGLAVLDGDEIVALASWDRPVPHAAEAEVAVLVEDAWQHRGLGRALVRMLAGRARRQGIERFTATLLSDNRAALHLAATSGAPRWTERAGPEATVEIPLVA
jgi:GNAT superfamily N-acetyltransferase